MGLTEAEAFSVGKKMLDVFGLSREWTFMLDRAKTRAGVCKHSQKVISVSKYFIAAASPDDFRQVMLHEIAHAIVGHGAGHGPLWRSTALKIGYRGGRTVPSFSEPLQHANWVGACPAGHKITRIRKPSRETSCGTCSREFSKNHLIVWKRVRS